MERTITLTPLWRAFLKAVSEGQTIFFFGGQTYTVSRFAEDELRRR